MTAYDLTWYKLKSSATTESIWTATKHVFYFKDTQVGPLLVLVSHCFRENVNVTCKIVFFFSLDNFLLKNVFFFWNQISKWRSFEKGLFLTYFSHFLATREKTQKFLQHISHLHTYTYFAHPIDFFAFPILQKKKKKKKKRRIYYVWFLFGVTPGVDSVSRHFGAINNEMVSKI